MADLPTGTVTFLFTDIEGSTRLWEQEPRAMQAALARHDALLRQAIENHCGHVFKTVGDAFYAAFESPELAVTAAIATQHALSKEKLPLRVRMAIHQGAAEEREGDYFGPALNRVARLLAAGHGGQVLLSASTAAQLPPELLAEIDLRSLGVHRLRDITAREAIFQLLAPGLPAKFPPLNTLDVAFRRGLLRAAAVAGVILAIVTSLAVIAHYQARRADRNARAEKKQRRLAEAGQESLRRHLYASQTNLAEQALDVGNTPRAIELLAGQRPEPGKTDLRGWEWRYLWRLAHEDDSARTLHASTEGRCVVLSPDGRWLAVSGDPGGAVRLWNVAAGREAAPLRGHRQIVNNVSFSADGKLLVTASDDQTVKLWDMTSRRAVATFSGPKPAGWAALSRDGRILAAGSSDNQTGSGNNQIRVWERATGRLAAALNAPHAMITNMVLSPDGRTLAAGDFNAVRLWDLRARRQVAVLPGPGDYVGSMAFSPDGMTLATSGANSGTVTLWDLARRHVAGHLVGHSGDSVTMAFSPDGRLLATGAPDRTVRLWSMETRDQIAVLRGHQGPVTGVWFSPDGKTVLSTALDHTVKFWPTTRTAVEGLNGSHPSITGLAVSSDGKMLASAGDGGVKLWDLVAKREIATLPRSGATVLFVAISPDGQRVAAGSSDDTVAVWDQATRQRIALLKLMRYPFHPVAFSPNGRVLAYGNGRTIGLWDVATRRQIGWLPAFRNGDSGIVNTLSFSPDSRLLASGAGVDSTVKLWDVPRQRLAYTFTGFANFSAAGPFSPDGRWLTTYDGAQHLIRVWEVVTKQLVASLKGHDEQISWLGFCPDGRTVATCSEDKSIRLWSTASWLEAATFKDPLLADHAGAFSADGNTLITGRQDGSARLWRAPSLTQADAEADAEAGKDLRLVAAVERGQVTTSWQPVGQAAGYHVYRGAAGATLDQLLNRPFQEVAGTTVTEPAPGQMDRQGRSYAVAALLPAPGRQPLLGPRAMLQIDPQSSPSGWVSASIAEGTRSGSIKRVPSSGGITIRSRGEHIWDRFDGCFFGGRRLRGDGQITARVLTRPSNPSTMANAGVMIRESLASGARHVSLLVTADDGLVCVWRPAADSVSRFDNSLPTAALKLPITLRLTRRGSTIQPEYSQDGGRSFHLAAPPVEFGQPLSPMVYAGLAVTGGTPDQVSEAKFQDVEIK